MCWIVRRRPSGDKAKLTRIVGNGVLKKEKPRFPGRGADAGRECNQHVRQRHVGDPGRLRLPAVRPGPAAAFAVDRARPVTREVE